MSLRFSWRIVSLTAWKTKRMFSVSMAVVKWWKSGLLRLRRFAVEALHKIGLHVHQSMRVSSEVGKVFANVDFAYLLHQKVHLVEEEDYGHIGKELVVDYGLKDVHGLHQTVGAAVFHQHLVELAGGHHEEDGGDAVKALKPLLSLRALATHIYHLKRIFLMTKSCSTIPLVAFLANRMSCRLGT